MMNTVLPLFILVVVATAQRPYGSYGSYGGYNNGGFGRPIVGGGSIGGGGPIIFPDSGPVVSRPIGGIHSTGGIPIGGGIGGIHAGGVQPVGGIPVGGIQSIGGVQPVGGLQSVGGFPTGGVQPVGGIQSVGGFPTGGVKPVGGLQSVGGIQSSGQCDRNQIVHASQFGSDYHFSWCADGGQKYEWQEAAQVCSRLGPGWAGISIEDFAENEFVTQTIAAHNLEYIWTGGQRAGHGWSWPSGRPFTPIAWSHTGLLGKPQPDNQEDNIENCLAVLNNFYQDGIKWHDVACYHPKAIICERSAVASAPGPIVSAPGPAVSAPVPGYG